MQGDVVTVERVIAASPESVFALLADASKHPEIDGSGAVRSAKPGAAQKLTMGSRFGMAMKMGLPYSMMNEVIEYQDGRRIAWQTRASGFMGRLVGGRIWRYELEPTGSGTRVRESWDLSQDRQRALLRRGPVPKQTRQHMEKTLERIEQLTKP